MGPPVWPPGQDSVQQVGAQPAPPGRWLLLKPPAVLFPGLHACLPGLVTQGPKLSTATQHGRHWSPPLAE